MRLDSINKAGPNEPLIGRTSALTQLSTPALLLDLDVMDRNIEEMAARAKAAGTNLRPHSKGGKSIAIARRQIASGAVGVCCATLGEAEVMVEGGISGVLITSPVVTPSMINRLVKLNARADRLAVVADHAANAEALASACSEAPLKPLSIIVEFDVGQRRTGVLRQEEAVTLAHRIKNLPQLRYAGIQAYYGHLQHIPIYVDRKAAAEKQLSIIRDLAERLNSEDLAPDVVTGGGTGTFEVDLLGKVYTEIQPGSYPFMDREYTEIEWATDRAPFETSLTVVASVVSSNREGFAVVNAGYKSFATEGKTPLVLSPVLRDANYAFLGDEHGGINYDPAGGRLRVGDLVEFLTPHCDPTINLYDRYHCMRGDTLIDIWEVDARGH